MSRERRRIPSGVWSLGVVSLLMDTSSELIHSLLPLFLTTVLGASTVPKPVFPLANSVLWVFLARFVDRIGKGVCGAPRDALIADMTPVELRGAAFGLRQAMDSVGAVLGPACDNYCICAPVLAYRVEVSRCSPPIRSGHEAEGRDCQYAAVRSPYPG
jgi:MFS family permease